MNKYTKAKAHMLVLLNQLNNIYDVSTTVYSSYDLDTAIGKELDVIGRIVGINRRVQEIYSDGYFGFSNNPKSGNLVDKASTSTTNSKKFKNRFKAEQQVIDLNDTDYRVLVKARLVKNITNGRGLINPSQSGIFNALDYIFDSNVLFSSYTGSMTLTIKVDTSFSSRLIYHLLKLDLIPRPYGVEYDIIQEAL